MKVSYPPDLPITAHREELLRVIEDNQVVIVAGETGSGKSTQLPKLCLELGRGQDGWIGHTQPRRLAARSVAERIASEMQTDLGALVGYTVRFTDQVSKNTRVKLMTDGILLAEMQRDRLLKRYDTIIIDEAHERSLNIDFLLGYLRQLLPRRPDLKIIITSATIDTERFSQHFDDAPIIEVSGRSFPVEMRYRPLVDETEGRDIDQPDGIAEAVLELCDEGPGDILVFLSGERDIREAADALEALKLDQTEIFPLYARLSAAEQHRVFSDHRGRRIVLATNVAETSLTVPGIRYVIDPGNARISRYSHRTKVQRLPIEPVSQASANQRAGRCGRVGPGICIRLYDEEDYLSRPEFTDPEIQRTNLASVILQMASLNLGDVEAFPFVDPPESRSIRDGIALLEELDAVDPDRAGTRKWLTPLGREIARFPLDPRLARMVLEASGSGCLHEVMVITSGMSIIDPRERPQEKRPVANEFHKRFEHPESDFLSLVKMWDHLEHERKERSRNQFRRMCGKEFLNHNRIREWRDIYNQVHRVAKEMKLPRNDSPADPDNVHQALLTGLLSQIGMKDGKSQEFRGARNARFVIAPGSVFYKNSPAWAMAGELVETNRLYARTVTRIRPEWAEKAGEHLVTRSYGDPWWDATRGTAMTEERVTLYGLPLVSGRRISVRKVNPDTARELFIHHALVQGEWETVHRFDEHNRSVLEEIRTLEARSRRRDLFVEYDTLYAFYDERIPADVGSTRDFDGWWKKKRRKEPELLNLVLEDLLGDDPDALLDHDRFPESWPVAGGPQAGGFDLELSYEFDHGNPNDGVTVTVPVGTFGQLDAGEFEWSVPGFREELVTALIRSLPKPLRREFVPVPDTVAAILPNLARSHGSLFDALRAELQRHKGIQLPVDVFDLQRVPDHLRPTFVVINDEGAELATGKDLTLLAQHLDQQVRDALTSGRHDIEERGLTAWTFGDLPQRVSTESAGRTVDAFPALVDCGDTVSVELMPTADEQHTSMWTGTRRLIRLQVGTSARMLNDMLSNRATLALTAGPYDGKAAWIEDCALASIDQLLREAGGPVWTQAAFDDLLAKVRADLVDTISSTGELSIRLLLANHALATRLERTEADALTPAVDDMRSHLGRLVYPGFITGIGLRRLPDVLRYLKAIAHRIEKLPSRIGQDQQLAARCRRVENLLDRTLAARGWSPEIEDVVWMLEELRVSLFAQQVGVLGKVSEKRIEKALTAIANA